MEQEGKNLGMVKPDDEGFQCSIFCVCLKFSKKKSSSSTENSCRNERSCVCVFRAGKNKAVLGPASWLSDSMTGQNLEKPEGPWRSG